MCVVLLAPFLTFVTHSSLNSTPAHSLQDQTLKYVPSFSALPASRWYPVSTGEEGTPISLAVFGLKCQDYTLLFRARLIIVFVSVMDPHGVSCAAASRVPGLASMRFIVPNLWLGSAGHSTFPVWLLRSPPNESPQLRVLMHRLCHGCHRAHLRSTSTHRFTSSQV